MTSPLLRRAMVSRVSPGTLPPPRTRSSAWPASPGPGEDQHARGAPDHLAAAVAEDRLGRAAEGHDDAVVVEHDDAVRDVVHDRLEAELVVGWSAGAISPSGRHGTALGEHPEQGAGRIPQRRVAPDDAAFLAIGQAQPDFAAGHPGAAERLLEVLQYCRLLAGERDQLDEAPADRGRALPAGQPFGGAVEILDREIRWSATTRARTADPTARRAAGPGRPVAPPRASRERSRRAGGSAPAPCRPRRRPCAWRSAHRPRRPGRRSRRTRAASRARRE